MPEEEDLPRLLLAHLTCQQRRAVAAVEARHVRIRLLEDGVLLARERQVTHHVQAVPAAHGPARHHGDDHLGHEADQPLHLEDVKPAQAARVGLAGLVALVLVAVLAADALVSARAEGPPAVLGRGPVAGDEHAAHVGGHARMVERGVQLVHGPGAEGVAHLGPVEGDAHGALVHGPVVGDVLELEAVHGAPARGVEEGGNLHGRVTPDSGARGP